MVILYAMKRPIYVRPLSDAERETLEAGLRSPDAFTLRRCQIFHLLAHRGPHRLEDGHPTQVELVGVVEVVPRFETVAGLFDRLFLRAYSGSLGS